MGGGRLEGDGRQCEVGEVACEEGEGRRGDDAGGCCGSGGGMVSGVGVGVWSSSCHLAAVLCSITHLAAVVETTVCRTRQSVCAMHGCSEHDRLCACHTHSGVASRAVPVFTSTSRCCCCGVLCCQRQCCFCCCCCCCCCYWCRSIDRSS